MYCRLSDSVRRIFDPDWKNLIFDVVSIIPGPCPTSRGPTRTASSRSPRAPSSAARQPTSGISSRSTRAAERWFSPCCCSSSFSGDFICFSMHLGFTRLIFRGPCLNQDLTLRKLNISSYFFIPSANLISDRRPCSLISAIRCVL